jgi:signal transduction histidine kinase
MNMPSALQELAEENARLKEALAARDTFLAVAAHELRNPMTPIMGLVSILRHAVSEAKISPEKIERDLDQIESRMSLFVKRAIVLLDVSRLTTGKFRVDRNYVDVCKVAKRVATNYRLLADFAGSTLELALPLANLGVIGDELAIEQVLGNLVSNAIKYGASTPVCLTAVADDDVARITVKDGGPGISAASQARIFEQFERAVQPEAAIGGFGVGLWIVKQLCDAMGGALEVTSSAGSGSTFCVTLPLYRSNTYPSKELA